MNQQKLLLHLEKKEREYEEDAKVWGKLGSNMSKYNEKYYEGKSMAMYEIKKAILNNEMI